MAPITFVMQSQIPAVASKADVTFFWNILSALPLTHWSSSKCDLLLLIKSVLYAFF